MEPEIYYDLKEMSNRAARYFWNQEEWPPEKAREWREFAEEVFQFAREIWNRYYVVDHSGKEVL